AEARVAARFRARRCAAASAVLLGLVPQDERPRLGDQVRLVGGERTAQVAKIVKLPQFRKGSVLGFIDLEGEYRPVAVHAEENAFLLPQVLPYVLAPGEHRAQRLTRRQALVAPYRYEQRPLAVDRLVQPLG